MIRSTRPPEGSQRPPGWLQVSPGHWLPEGGMVDASCNFTVSFLSYDVKTTKFNQHLPVDLTLLSMSIARFQKLLMFWMWRYHGTTLWHHRGGAWHNGMFLTTARDVNCWAHIANHMTQLWQVGDMALRWRHYDQDSVSNHQPHGCLLNRLFRRRSNKTSKLRVTGLCVGNSPGPVNSPHKGPVTRKMFPFDDVIMENFKYRIMGSVNIHSIKLIFCQN